MLPPLPAERHHAPLLLAFSGGLDSTALLHRLASDPSFRGNNLRAVHVHHGLHAQADAWATHCQRFCDTLGVTLLVVRVDVARDSGEGLEAAARQARYAAIRDMLAPGEVLVTAHHRDDQAETFLLRALRASGPDGLAAMRDWRAFAHGWHWRPLLRTPRSALLAYAERHGLDWIEDPSNADADFDRNFLRQRVLPLLRERWPHADAAFARSAQLSAEASGLLAEADARALATAATLDARTLSVSALLALPAPRRSRVLRCWIRRLGLPPLPAEGLARIETELLPARADAEARFDWHGATIRRWRDLLHASVLHPALPAAWRQDWDGRLPLVLPEGSTLSLEGANALPSPVQAHARAGGERIVLPGRRHSTTLKNVLLDLGVPPWTRDVLPLLSTPAGELLAAGDLAYSAGFDAWLRELRARLVWAPPPQKTVSFPFE